MQNPEESEFEATGASAESARAHASGDPYATDPAQGVDKTSTGDNDTLIEELGKHLVEMEIVDTATFSQVCTTLGPRRNYYTVVDELLRTGKLSQFQCMRLKGGSINDIRFDDYVLIDKLGEGGMGEVFKAQNIVLGRLEAIKMVVRVEGLSQTLLKRFKQEARVLARLEHPAIVPIYKVGQHGNIDFIAMKYVEGENLASKTKRTIDANEWIPCDQACHWISVVADALDHAHKQNVIHRDIKPGNIMLTPAGEIIVLDMGIARLADAASQQTSALTMKNRGLGTPDYMPPEQWSDATAVTNTSDIYSLGGTLFYVLTGRPPFVKDNQVKLMKAHMNEPAPSLSTVRRDVPAGLDAVIAKMMAKKPEDRYASAREVVDALAPFVGSAASRTRTGGLLSTIPAIPIVQKPPKPWTKQLIPLAAVAIVTAGVVLMLSRKGEAPTPSPVPPHGAGEQHTHTAKTSTSKDATGSQAKASTDAKSAAKDATKAPVSDAAKKSLTEQKGATTQVAKAETKTAPPIETTDAKSKASTDSMPAKTETTTPAKTETPAKTVADSKTKPAEPTGPDPALKAKIDALLSDFAFKNAADWKSVADMRREFSAAIAKVVDDAAYRDFEAEVERLTTERRRKRLGDELRRWLDQVRTMSMATWPGRELEQFAEGIHSLDKLNSPDQLLAIRDAVKKETDKRVPFAGCREVLALHDTAPDPNWKLEAGFVLDPAAPVRFIKNPAVNDTLFLAVSSNRPGFLTVVYAKKETAPKQDQIFVLVPLPIEDMHVNRFSIFTGERERLRFDAPGAEAVFVYMTDEQIVPAGDHFFPFDDDSRWKQIIPAAPTFPNVITALTSGRAVPGLRPNPKVKAWTRTVINLTLQQ